MISKDEVYVFLCGKFQVFPIYEWAKKNLEIVSVSLENVAQNYGFIGNKNSQSTSLFRLDKDYAKNLSKEDVEQPLLFVKLGEEAGCLMIDGTHRAYHQWYNGEKEADAYLIDNDDIILKHSSMNKKMLKALRA